MVADIFTQHKKTSYGPGNQNDKEIKIKLSGTQSFT